MTQDPSHFTPTGTNQTVERIRSLIETALHDNKAADIVTINLTGKSDVADYMIIADGTSSRHVSSLADKVITCLKQEGIRHINIEGKQEGDWILVDVMDVVVHLFRSDIRQLYNLEKMWQVELPQSQPEYV